MAAALRPSYKMCRLEFVLSFNCVYTVYTFALLTCLSVV